MENILIKINEGKEAHVNGETKNEDKKEEKEGNANNNINKVNKEELHYLQRCCRYWLRVA